MTLILIGILHKKALAPSLTTRFPRGCHPVRLGRVLPYHGYFVCAFLFECQQQHR